MFLRDPVRFAPYYRLSVLLVFSHVTSNIINQQLEQKFQRVIRRKLTAVQPDGRVVTADDPNRSIQGMLDARFVLRGDATVSSSGVVMAGTKLKVGTPVVVTTN